MSEVQITQEDSTIKAFKALQSDILQAGETLKDNPIPYGYPPSPEEPSYNSYTEVELAMDALRMVTSTNAGHTLSTVPKDNLLEILSILQRDAETIVGNESKGKGANIVRSVGDEHLARLYVIEGDNLKAFSTIAKKSEELRALIERTPDFDQYVTADTAVGKHTSQEKGRDGNSSPNLYQAH